MTRKINEKISLSDFRFGSLEITTFTRNWCRGVCRNWRPLENVHVNRLIQIGRSNEEIEQIELQERRCEGHISSIVLFKGMLERYRWNKFNDLTLVVMPWDKSLERLNGRSKFTFKGSELHDNVPRIRGYGDHSYLLRAEHHYGSSWTDTVFRSWSQA